MVTYLEREKMRKLKNEGLKLEAIAKEMSCSITKAWHNTEGYGETFYKRWTEEQTKKLFDMRAAGKGYYFISLQLGHPINSCKKKYYTLLKKLGAGQTK
jgi:hypothetical protein